jgi:hypothetical protein
MRVILLVIALYFATGCVIDQVSLAYSTFIEKTEKYESCVKNGSSCNDHKVAMEKAESDFSYIAHVRFLIQSNFRY